VTVMGIPGTGIEVGRPSGEKRTGAQLPYDRFKWNISRVNCHRLFRGIYNHAVDSHLHDCEVWAFRDYGIRMDVAVQFARLHTFGGGVIGSDDQVGAGIWLDGNTNQGGPIYVENSPIGLLVEGNFNQVTGIYSHSCSSNNIKITGSGNVLSQFYGQWKPAETPIPATTNVLITGPFSGGNTLTDSYLTVDDAKTGIKIETVGDYHVIRNVRIGGYHEQEDAFAENAVGFDADVTLNYCTIIIDTFEMTTGIDLADGDTDRIGDYNVIWITTTNAAAELHSDWTTTVNPNETNDVRVNGVRYYRNP
jgi:hypothetical protein